MTHKELIEQTLEFWLYQLRNGKCTPEELKSICDNTIEHIGTDATVSDIAEFMNVKESSVRAKLSRSYFPSGMKPKRKVYYPFGYVLKLFKR